MQLFWPYWVSSTFSVYMIYAEVAWALVSSGTQVQPQITPDPDYLSVSYDYGLDSLKLSTEKLEWVVNKKEFHISESRSDI